MWIYLPPHLTSSPSAPASTEPTLDLNSCCEMLSQSATLNTKQVSSKSWLRAWKKKTYLQRLFGRISKPSTASLGVESWISSLRATRARASAVLASSSETKTLDISGLISPELFKKLSQNGYLSRTSETTSTSDLSKSEQTYSEWALTLKQEYTQRRKSASHIRGSGFLLWPTPDTTIGAPNKRANVKQWGEYKNLSLLAIAQTLGLWPTPRASDSHGTGKHGDGGLDLRTKVKMWPTPDVSSANRDMSKIRPDEQKRPNTKRTIGLPTAAAMWPTATARDWKDSGVTENVPTNALLGRAAVRWTGCQSHHPAQTILKDGHVCSPSCQRLSPQFVENLMNFPIGWSDYEPLAMQFALFKEAMHSYLCWLVTMKPLVV